MLDHNFSYFLHFNPLNINLFVNKKAILCIQFFNEKLTHLFDEQFKYYNNTMINYFDNSFHYYYEMLCGQLPLASEYNLFNHNYCIMIYNLNNVKILVKFILGRAHQVSNLQTMHMSRDLHSEYPRARIHV